MKSALLFLALPIIASAGSLDSIEWRHSGLKEDEYRLIRARREAGGFRLRIVNTFRQQAWLDREADLPAGEWETLERLVAGNSVPPGRHRFADEGGSMSIEVATSNEKKSAWPPDGNGASAFPEIRARLEKLADDLILRPAIEKLGLREIELERIEAFGVAIRSFRVTLVEGRPRLRVRYVEGPGRRMDRDFVEGDLDVADWSEITRIAFFHELPDWKPASTGKRDPDGVRMVRVVSARENRQSWSESISNGAGLRALWSLLEQLLDRRILRPMRDAWALEEIRMVNPGRRDPADPDEVSVTHEITGWRVVRRWLRDRKSPEIETVDIDDAAWDALVQTIQDAGLMEWKPDRPTGSGAQSLLELRGATSNVQSWTGPCRNAEAFQSFWMHVGWLGKSAYRKGPDLSDPPPYGK